MKSSEVWVVIMSEQGKALIVWCAYEYQERAEREAGRLREEFPQRMVDVTRCDLEGEES